MRSALAMVAAALTTATAVGAPAAAATSVGFAPTHARFGHAKAATSRGFAMNRCHRRGST